MLIPRYASKFASLIGLAAAIGQTVGLLVGDVKGLAAGEHPGWKEPWALGGERQTVLATSATDLEQWIQSEYIYALEHIVQNVLPNGAVIASPSKSHPDYYYHWVRDAGLVMDLLAQLLPENPTLIQPLLELYANFSKKLQQTPNLSNSPGEPKWNVDGSDYRQPWGRPQNDSPAIRAYSLIRYANYLLERNQTVAHLYHHANFLTGIKGDLEFVSHHWQDTCFDIWEEVEGTHFYTRMVQRRALREGADLADRLGDDGAARFYRMQAGIIESTLDDFWDPDKGYMVVTVNRTGGIDYKYTGLDVQIILSALHAGLGDGVYTPDNDRVLATATELNKAFAALYPINSRYIGTAIGRYPEDTYDGYDTLKVGNPWPLATLAMSQIYYHLTSIWATQGRVDLTDVVRTKLLPVLGLKLASQPAVTADKSLQTARAITRDNPEFLTTLESLLSLGDHYMYRVQRHTDLDGRMFEQWNRNTGVGQGAYDLNWSYAAFISAARARNHAKDLLKSLKQQQQQQQQWWRWW